jgi:hypothetical protein
MKTATRLIVGLFALAAAAAALGACQGSSGRIDYDYWNHLYGDPDTVRPDTGAPRRCCHRASRNN